MLFVLRIWCIDSYKTKNMAFSFLILSFSCTILAAIVIIQFDYLVSKVDDLLEKLHCSFTRGRSTLDGGCCFNNISLFFGEVFVFRT